MGTLSPGAWSGMAMSLTDAVRLPETLAEEVIRVRRDLHAHPELGFEEVRTAGIVAARLRALGYEVREKVGRTGVVGIMRSGRPGRTVLLRADMDALPLTEESGVPFASLEHGKMHACGHDGHVAILLGAADMLARLRDEVCGTLVLCFQPAEEGRGGAAAMIADGVLDQPHVDAVYGLHLWSEHPAGMVLTRPGPMMASSDTIEVTITGRGGHGAQPHRTVDPILTAASVVQALQTVVSRRVDPLEPAVVTIGSLVSGTAHNVIPQTARLLGTVRTFDESVRNEMPTFIEDVVAGCCAAAGATYELDYRRVYGVTRNDPGEAAYVRSLAASLLGPQRVAEQPKIMGSEDFSFFLERRPGCFFFVGAGRPGESNPPHHSPQFTIDESALATGVQMMVALGLDAPRRPSARDGRLPSGSRDGIS
jgi:amidohydrolase